MFGMGTGGTLRLLSPEICGCKELYVSAFLFSPASFLSHSHLENRTGKFDLSVRRFRVLLTVLLFLVQALDLLGSSTFICYHTSSDDLSTSSSLRGLTCL